MGGGASSPFADAVFNLCQETWLLSHFHFRFVHIDYDDFTGGRAEVGEEADAAHWKSGK